MNNNDEIYLNDVVMEEEKIEKSPNFSQVCKEKKILMQMKGKKELVKILKNYIFKEESGNMIVEMHYVGQLIV